MLGHQLAQRPTSESSARDDRIPILAIGELPGLPDPSIGWKRDAESTLESASPPHFLEEDAFEDERLVEDRGSVHRAHRVARRGLEADLRASRPARDRYSDPSLFRCWSSRFSACGAFVGGGRSIWSAVDRPWHEVQVRISPGWKVIQ